jgi:hypothetical protein
MYNFALLLAAKLAHPVVNIFARHNKGAGQQDENPAYIFI